MFSLSTRLEERLPTDNFIESITQGNGGIEHPIVIVRITTSIVLNIWAIGRNVIY